MVNKDTFLHLIRQPQDIPDADLGGLEEVIRIFPYCSLVHTLIAKAHYDRASMLAAHKLRQAATYALERETLKLLMLGGENPEKTDTMPSVSPNPGNEVAGNAAHDDDTRQDLDALVAEFSRIHQSSQLLDAPRPGSPFSLLDSADDETPPLQLGHLNEDESAIEDFSRRLKKSVQRGIIDSFIKSDARIPTLNMNAKDSFTDRDLSEKGAAPPEIVSESLARIMAGQGKTQRAIAIYEKMRLKHPEKNAYFAAKIEELKNL